MCGLDASLRNTASHLVKSNLSLSIRQYIFNHLYFSTNVFASQAINPDQMTFTSRERNHQTHLAWARDDGEIRRRDRRVHQQTPSDDKPATGTRQEDRGGDSVAFLDLVRTPLVRDGGDVKLPKGQHVRHVVYGEMLAQICLDYNSLPNPRTLTCSEIAYFYDFRRAELKRLTRADDE